MNKIKMSERINGYQKEPVFEQYTRIIEKFKDYDRVTKKKMLEEIYKFYMDSENIIDLCTVRELSYLKWIIDKKKDMEELFKEKYEWERITLKNKFLVLYTSDEVVIPDEIIFSVKKALENVDWVKAKQKDDLNEILVGYCNTQGLVELSVVLSIARDLTGKDTDTILEHIKNNKLFYYYVTLVHRKSPETGEKLSYALCHRWYDIQDEIEEQRKKQGVNAFISMGPERLQIYFYNNFDRSNKKIKKLFDELSKLPFLWFYAVDRIREFAMLNLDRTPLKQSFKDVPVLKNYDLTHFFKVLDEAMDEMPSGALNGFTPNLVKELRIEQERLKKDKTRKYVKQQNACVSKKNAALFYKIYFGLLEFTNQKYKIKNNLKIYNNKYGINPNEIKEIVEKFWNNKEFIVLEFCMRNPYKFNKEELKIARDFKNGFRDNFIIIKYEREYTAIMNNEKVYMIKGLYENIDQLIPYQKLPKLTKLAIIPFKNILIYDGILMDLNVQLGENSRKEMEEDYEKSLKYYHL